MQPRTHRVNRTHTYTIILEPDEDGGFVVHVPALPEVCTQGDTEDDALAMAKEAIELAIEHRLAEGEDVPAELQPQLRRVTITLPAPSNP